MLSVDIKLYCLKFTEERAFNSMYLRDKVLKIVISI